MIGSLGQKGGNGGGARWGKVFSSDVELDVCLNRRDLIF